MLEILTTILSVSVLISNPGGFEGELLTEPGEDNVLASTVNSIIIEDATDKGDYSLLQALLALDLIQPGETGTQWKFVVVYNDETRGEIMDCFIDRFALYYKRTKVPKIQVRSYWENIFMAPLQVYVFAEKNNIPMDQCRDWKQSFSDSEICEHMVCASTDLKMGFFWMGTISIVAPEVHEILEVTDDYKLVTAIFLRTPGSKALTFAR